MNGAIVVSSVTKEGKTWEDSAKEVIRFWRIQQYQWDTVADSLDMNPMYHFWLDIVHNTSKVFKHSVTELIELYSNMNPSFKKWYDDMLTNWFSVDQNFWKDYFVDGWYIPATAEAARRYYSAKQFDRLGAPNEQRMWLSESYLGQYLANFFTYQSNQMPNQELTTNTFSTILLRRP